jgi:hypothetical protein
MTQARVNATFDALLQRLQIYAADRGELSHMYEATIIPVVLVDAGGVTLQATSTPFPLGTPASAGELTAPAAATRLADTGALAAGQWNVFLMAGCQDTSNLRLKKRNSGDTADVWAQRLYARGGGTATRDETFDIIGPLRITLANNERLVVETVGGSTAGAIYNANIWTQGPF